jgi:aspartate carbamoyltransferase catalytic subunit
VANLSVAIVGDLSHSRVARSTARALLTLGVGELRLVSPASLMPAAHELAGASRHHSLAEGIQGADVVMALRIQHERMSGDDKLDAATFYREWGLGAENLRHAHPDVIVMHPGPINRGVELTSEVADGPHSVIRQQVTNGVAVRMAVLSTIVRNVQERNVEAGRRAV